MQNLEIIIKEFNKNLDATSENILITAAMLDLENNTLPPITTYIQNITTELTNPMQAARALDMVANNSQDELQHCLLTDHGLAVFAKVKTSLLFLNQILINRKETNQILQQIIVAHGIKLDEKTEKYEEYLENLRYFLQKLIVAKAVAICKASYYPNAKLPPDISTNKNLEILTQCRTRLNNSPLAHNFLEQTPKVFDEKTLSILPIKDMVLNRCPITLDDITQKNGIMVISFGKTAKITFYSDKETMHAWFDHHPTCPLTLNENYIYLPLAKLTTKELLSLTEPSGLLYQGSLDEAQPGSYAKTFFDKAWDWTPLMLAVAANDIEEVTKLITTTDIDLSLCDHNGKNVIDIAFSEESSVIGILLNELSTVSVEQQKKLLNLDMLGLLLAKKSSVLSDAKYVQFIVPIIKSISVQDLAKMLPQFSPEACKEVCQYINIQNVDDIAKLLQAMSTKQKIVAGSNLGNISLLAAFKQQNIIFDKKFPLSQNNKYITFDLLMLVEAKSILNGTPFIEILKIIHDFNFTITCKNWTDFRAATQGLSNETVALICGSMREQWCNIIAHRNNLNSILSMSSTKKCQEICQEIQAILPQIITNTDDLVASWGEYFPLPADKFHIVYSSMLPIMPNIIHNAKDLSRVLHYLTPEQCENICILLKEKMSQLITHSLDFYTVIHILPPKQQAVVSKIITASVPQIVADAKKLSIRVSAADRKIYLAGPEEIIANLETTALRKEISSYRKTSCTLCDGSKTTSFRLDLCELENLMNGLVHFINQVPQDTVGISPLDQQILEYWAYEEQAISQGKSTRLGNYVIDMRTQSKISPDTYELTDAKILSKIFSAIYTVHAVYPEAELVFNLLENSREMKKNRIYYDPPMPDEDELAEFIEHFQPKDHSFGLC